MIEILAVDDEPLVLLTIRSLCDWAGHGMRIAHECENGKAALEYVRAHPEIDVVLTDVEMPVMDGLALAEALSAEGFGAAIIFLSSYGNFEYVRRAFKSGACDYILKTELDESRVIGLIGKVVKKDGADSEVPSVLENCRNAFFRELLGGTITDIGERFASCAFSSSCPFGFMVVRPGDMPLVRKRYGNDLFDFQKTVSDLLRHFIPHGEGDSGAISFDLYYVFMPDREKMENSFELFYESAWSYMDIGFERRIGEQVSDLGDLQAAFASCVREFVPPSRIVVRSRRFIREHFGDPGLSLSDIAEYSEVSKNHLSWEFTRETGETISDFLTRTRIQESKKLLLETNLRTFEIAEKAGYANVETFCRAFRKVTGTSPRRFS